jgi:hypothetical protein
MNCPICKSELMYERNFYQCKMFGKYIADAHYWIHEDIINGGSQLEIDEYLIYNNFASKITYISKHDMYSFKTIITLPIISEKDIVNKLHRIIKLIAFI